MTNTELERIERLEADLTFLAGFLSLKDKGHATAKEHERAREIAQVYMDHRFEFKVAA